MCLLWLQSELLQWFLLYTFNSLPTPYSVGVLLCWVKSVEIIGASLSEPHTNVTALRKCVCIRACLLVCGHIP